MWLFGGRAFMDGLGLSEDLKVNPWSSRTCVLIKEQEIPVVTLPAMWGHHKVAICKPGGSDHQNMTQLAFWSQTSSLKTCEKIISVV